MLLLPHRPLLQSQRPVKEASKPRALQNPPVDPNAARGMVLNMTIVRTASTALLTALICLGAIAPDPAPPLNAALSDMAYFLGSWKCDGSFPSSGKTIASTMRFDADLAGNAVVKHHDDVAPSSYRAVEAWNYDATAKRYNDAISDNFGGVRLFATDGWHDGVLTWSSAAAVKPAQQFVYTRLSPTSMRVDWQVSKDGTHYSIGDTLTCERAMSS